MSKNLKGCYSHKTDDWRTPTDIYNAFMKKGYIDCFPYQSKVNELCNLYIEQKLFINPPYSKMNQIIYWLLDQIGNDNKVALLVPVRTDTKWFKQLILDNPCVCVFISGRLHFNDSKECAPFPSALLLFNYHADFVNTFTIFDRKDIAHFIEELL